MIVPQAEIDLIRGKMRKRILTLPVRHERVRGTARHPKTGRVLGSPSNARGGLAIKQCPMQVGGEPVLKPRIPYDRYQHEADSQPSRARAVLRLIDLCETPTRTVTITVTSVERQGDVWLVRFEKGKRPELFDRDVFLCRDNDFTMDASRQTVQGDPPYLAPLAEDLRRARAKASEQRASPQREILSRMQIDAQALARSLAEMKDRQRLKRVEFLQREMSKLAVQLSVDDRGILSTSAHAESPVSPASEVGAERPERISSDAPLTEHDIESMTDSEFDALNAEADHVVAVALETAA